MAHSARKRRPTATSLRRDRRGVAAVETALLMLPFISLMFPIVGVGIYYVNQSWLDAGVLAAADYARVTWQNSCAATVTAATLKPQVSANTGAGIGVSSLAVDLYLVSDLASGSTPISDGTTDANITAATGGAVVLRASMPVNMIFPRLVTASVTSLAVFRRPACGGTG